MEILAYGFTGKIWVNGQFGVARAKETSVSVSKTNLVRAEGSRWLRAVAVHGVQATIDFIHGSDEYYQDSRGMLPVPEAEGITGVAAPPIGLSLLPKRHKRGSMGITTHGQKVVRCAAKLLQERFGRNRLSFLTVTVPGMSSDNLALISDDWQRIVKVFVQKLKRALLAVGLSEEIVGVTEIQESRVASRGELALHLHLLFQGAKTPWAWEYPPKFYRELWLSVLDSVVPRSEWSFEDAVEEVRSVKHSAEGYLGKYMSKGAKNLFVVRERFPGCSLPSAWWHCTFKLRRKVLRSVCHVSHRSADYLVELIETCPDLFDYLKVVRIRFGERDIGVGWCGRIAPDRLEEIRAVCYGMKEDRLSAMGVSL